MVIYFFFCSALNSACSLGRCSSLSASSQLLFYASGRPHCLKSKVESGAVRPGDGVDWSPPGDANPEQLDVLVLTALTEATQAQESQSRISAMNQFESAAAVHLREIGASCPLLLHALQVSPEAGWGEIMRVETACQSLKRDCGSCGEATTASEELLTHVEALRAHLAKAGTSSYDAFAAFRESVAALQHCVARWQPVIEATIPGSVPA